MECCLCQWRRFFDTDNIPYIIQNDRNLKTFSKIELLSEHKSWILILMAVFSSAARRMIIKSAKTILIWIEQETDVVFIDVFWAGILIIDRLWDIWERRAWIWTWRDINQRHFLAEKSDRWLKTADHVCLIWDSMLHSTCVLASFVFNLTSELYLAFWRASWISKKIFW